jgi:hypothetical protein
MVDDDLRSTMVRLGGETRPVYPVLYLSKVRQDQFEEGMANIRRACAYGLPVLSVSPAKKGKMIIVGGSPSVEQHMSQIRELAADPENGVFPLNYMHTRLLSDGVRVDGCFLFEIDVDPNQILGHICPETTYYVCSLCHEETFKQLLEANARVVLWHAATSEERYNQVLDEVAPNQQRISGGCTTFIRTLVGGLIMGYRSFEIFGVDSSFPDDASSTHVYGYPTITQPAEDGIDAWVTLDDSNGNRVSERKFRTVGYLMQQAEHFRDFCKQNHFLFRCRVHGDGLLAHIHRMNHPREYTDEPQRAVRLGVARVG